MVWYAALSTRAAGHARNRLRREQPTSVRLSYPDGGQARFLTGSERRNRVRLTSARSVPSTPLRRSAPLEFVSSDQTRNLRPQDGTTRLGATPQNGPVPLPQGAQSVGETGLVEVPEPAGSHSNYFRCSQPLHRRHRANPCVP